MIQDKAKLLNRLSRIAGQVKGVAGMVEDERYCIDVLTQTRAIHAALDKVEQELLRAHIGHCVRAAFASGDAAEQQRKTDELIAVLERAAR